MGQYSSYYLYQRYEKRGDQDWIPCTPNAYSISGDSTNPMPLVEKSSADTECGYTPEMYRWINLNPSIDYICDGLSKYYKQQKQVSYDGGMTWISLEEYRKGDLIDSQSSDCGEPIYQWNLVSGYLCDDCESTKVTAGVEEYTYNVACNGSTALTSGDVESMTAKTLIEWATIGNCVEAIDTNAFSGCSAIEFVRIPNSVKTIGNSAFYGCSAMTECSLPSGIQTIGNSAFTNSVSLAFVNLPDGITSVGDSAFRECLNFRYINIPNSLISISNYCFYDCDGMTDIELHSGITAIGNSAFENCSGIYSITLHSTTPPTLGTNALNGTNTNLKIYVPSASVDTYKAASGWSSYANKIYAIQ